MIAAVVHCLVLLDICCCSTLFAVVFIYICGCITYIHCICRFIHVPAPHIAEVIAEELHESLISWNLDEKLSTVTVDNCSSNDKTIDLLAKRIGKDKLMLQGTLTHMRCCAHILNLILKDGLDAMKPAIEKIRDSVAFWIASPNE